MLAPRKYVSAARSSWGGRERRKRFFNLRFPIYDLRFTISALKYNGRALFGKELFQPFNCLWKILPSQPQAEMILCIIIHRTGQEQNSGILYKPITKFFHIA